MLYTLCPSYPLKLTGNGSNGVTYQNYIHTHGGLFLTDDEILAFNCGDDKVYGKIYEHYVDWVSYIVYRNIQDGMEAEDIATEVMLKVLEKCASLHSVEDIQKFIFAITRNRIVDFVRWRNVRQKNAAEVAFRLKNQDDPSEIGNILDNNPDLLPALYAFIETLPPDERDTFTLIYITGLSHKDTATLLDKNKNTITKLKINAMQKIRQFMATKGFVMLWFVSEIIFRNFKIYWDLFHPLRYKNELWRPTPLYDLLIYTMEDRNYDIAQLLLKNLEGVLTSAEQQQLNAWVEASPVNRAIFNNIDGPESVLRELQLAEEARNIGLNVRKRIEKALTETQSAAPQPKPISSMRWWYSVAAAVIIGLITWLLLQSSEGNHPTVPKGTQPDWLVTTTTSRGELLKFNLPDNSLVSLNVDSRIQSPKSFPLTERKVQLEGGALFNIKPAYNNGKKIPFIVDIKDGNMAVGQIEVLGTSFNIDAYSNGPYYKATVLEGFIKLTSSSNDSKIVRAKQVAYWTKNGRIKVLNEDKPETDVLWQDSTLKFSNTPVQFVYQRLERVFDLTVEYKNNIKPERQFSGELYTPSGIRTVLNVINHQCDLSSAYDSLQRKIIVQ